jgi:hypothetical protein
LQQTNPSVIKEMAEGEWGEVTFNKRSMRAAEARSQKALNQAQRKGQGIDTSKKCNVNSSTGKQCVLIIYV